MGFWDGVSGVLNAMTWEETARDMHPALVRILKNAKTLQEASMLDVDRMINLCDGDEDVLRVVAEMLPSDMPGSFSTQTAIKSTAADALVAVLSNRY